MPQDAVPVAQASHQRSIVLASTAGNTRRVAQHFWASQIPLRHADFRVLNVDAGERRSITFLKIHTAKSVHQPDRKSR
jgi:hypothetical protein